MAAGPRDVPGAPELTGSVPVCAEGMRQERLRERGPLKGSTLGHGDVSGGRCGLGGVQDRALA